MKSTVFTIVLVASMLALIAIVQAQVANISSAASLPPAGLLPNSPIYGFKIFFENIQAFFTFGPIAKAELHLKFADQRLAELNQSVAQGLTQNIQSLQQAYEKELNDTDSDLHEAQALGRNATELANHVAEETSKHVTVLEGLLDKVPQQAKIHIEEAINRSETSHETPSKLGQSSSQQQVQQSVGYQGSYKFGFCDGFMSNTINDDIQDTKDLGFGWGRPLGSVFAQETVGQQNGSYDFSVPDAVVKQMQSNNIAIFGTLFPTGIPKIPQSIDTTSFANYVKAIVDRYNGDGKNDVPGLTTKITYWEVGIEPFCQTLGQACYKNFFDLVKTAYNAAKSVDPSIQISPGGAAPIFTPNGSTDPQSSSIFGYFFSNGGANYMDFFNFHYLVGSNGTSIKSYIDYWRKYVPANKDIWLSETGSRDVGDRYTISSDASVEANWVNQHISDSFQNGVSKIFWCRAEHSFSDMTKVVQVLQNYAKQYGGNPSGSPVKRQTTQSVTQQPSGQQTQQTNTQQGSTIQQPTGGQGGSGGGYCGDGICQDIERQTGGCPQDCGSTH